jgi:hypothetical protein
MLLSQARNGGVPNELEHRQIPGTDVSSSRLAQDCGA